MTEPRGRKAGLKYHSPSGSLNWHLGKLEIGESYWLETTKERYAVDARQVQKPKSRQTLDTLGKKFSVKTYRLVPPAIHEDVEVILKITREE